MSRFLKGRLKDITPYVPGEQPRDKRYIKLNTNESPFPPSPKVIEAVNANEISDLNLYSDPTADPLVTALADYNGVSRENVFVGNGSDEILAFLFAIMAERKSGAAFADVTYGFYPVFAKLYGVETHVIPTDENLGINCSAFAESRADAVIANPNAQTGLYVGKEEIRRIAERDSDRLVIVDEAYVDFGAESVIPLTKEYGNLVVVGTFSKSRSLAGARVGFAVASEEIIGDLNTVKYSFNPYNLNRLSIIAGTQAVKDRVYFEKCRNAVIAARENFIKEFRGLGGFATQSKGNFTLCGLNGISGKNFYEKLRERGILVRYFDEPKISGFVRITVGTDEQMRTLLDCIKQSFF